LKIIAVSGYKDCGKTTLCRALLAALSERGLSVGYIKRTREPVAPDPGTDSGSVGALGVPALLWGDGAFRLEEAFDKGREPDAYEAAGRFFPEADVVILEGGKGLCLPKIWVAKPGEEGGFAEGSGVFAVYDRFGPGDGHRRYGAGDLDRLVSDVARMAAPERRSARVFCGGKELPMKDFVADFVAGGLKGMLGALKKPGGDLSQDIRVYVKKGGA
jgi:molybdopterin-guanine dinucleotide biosynthesis protein B